MVAQRATHQHKRHGKHQKQTRHFLKVYWPYLPLAMILSIGLVFSVLWQPRSQHAVLAYATSMSDSALLQATNQQRAANGIGSLTINSQLDKAAQDKANDMANLNYWAHDPPGCPSPGTCWYKFVVSSGYKYKALGENLAYGYATSSDTVAGWMASPEHKANMLNGAYTNVGFGFVDKHDYVGDPNFPPSPSDETIVVAEYGQPLATPPAPVAASKPSSTSSSAPQTKASTQTTTTTPAAPAAQTVSTTPTPAVNHHAKSTPVTELPTKKVSRLSILTNGKLPWLASVVSVTLVLSVTVLALRHTIALRKWWRHGERYVLHHALFDVTVISLIGLCLIVSQSSGVFVR